MPDCSKLRHDFVALRIVVGLAGNFATPNYSSISVERIIVRRTKVVRCMDGYLQRMVWIALRITRIWHPILAKRDHFTCSRKALELFPILSDCLFFFGPNTEIKVAFLRVLIITARKPNRHDEHSRNADELRRTLVWLESHLVRDCVYPDVGTLGMPPCGVRERRMVNATNTTETCFIPSSRIQNTQCSSRICQVNIERGTSESRFDRAGRHQGRNAW